MTDKQRKKLIEALRTQARLRGVELDFDSEGGEVVAKRMLEWQAADELERLSNALSAGEKP